MSVGACISLDAGLSCALAPARSTGHPVLGGCSLPLGDAVNLEELRLAGIDSDLGEDRLAGLLEAVPVRTFL